MIVAIGSTRGPKVEAVRRALSILKERFPGFLRDDLRLIARTVSSGTFHATMAFASKPAFR